MLPATGHELRTVYHNQKATLNFGIKVRVNAEVRSGPIGTPTPSSSVLQSEFAGGGPASAGRRTRPTFAAAGAEIAVAEGQPAAAGNEVARDKTRGSPRGREFATGARKRSPKRPRRNGKEPVGAAPGPALPAATSDPPTKVPKRGKKVTANPNTGNAPLPTSSSGPALPYQLPNQLLQPTASSSTSDLPTRKAKGGPKKVAANPRSGSLNNVGSPNSIRGGPQSGSGASSAAAAENKILKPAASRFTVIHEGRATVSFEEWDRAYAETPSRPPPDPLRTPSVLDVCAPRVLYNTP
eukprot:1183186-Prorocentrum_minimum.AAC.7